MSISPHAVSRAAGTVIWYVAPDGDDTHDCRALASACQTIGATVTKSGTGDQIIASAGVYTEHLTLDKSLTLIATSPATTILDGQGSGTVITISNPLSATTVVTMTGFTIRNGGVGIMNEGVFTFSQSRVQQHSSRGMINFGTAILTDTLISNNAGGGLSNGPSGRVTLLNMTISANTATLQGGGILNTGVMTLTNVTVNGNQAALGGGIYTEGPAPLAHMVVSHAHTALRDAPAASPPSMLLTNVTLSNNQGGGIMRNGFVAVSAVNSIVAYNANSDCSAGGIGSLGYNLSSDSSCNFTKISDQMNIDPLLGSLQNNGGNTTTQALRPGSPAIDRGDPTRCPATDQRGVIRPVDGDSDGIADCDIGAYELRWLHSFLPIITTIR